MIKSLSLIGIGAVIGATAMFGWTFVSSHHSANQGDANQPYAGQDTRQITSLSAADIAQLEAGAGWGLAKAAELNGYPGPAHILELADDLDLTPQQAAAVQAEFAKMQAAAKALGRDLIAAEAALDDVFRNGSADPATLSETLTHAAAIRAKLRETHLAAHLIVTPILTEEQTQNYVELRGYNNSHAGHSGH